MEIQHFKYLIDRENYTKEQLVELESNPDNYIVYTHFALFITNKVNVLTICYYTNDLCVRAEEFKDKHIIEGLGIILGEVYEIKILLDAWVNNLRTIK